MNNAGRAFFGGRPVFFYGFYWEWVMREQEFRDYLKTLRTREGTLLTEVNKDFYVKACINIEKAENINLDEEFKKNGITSIFQLYKYSKQDEDNNRKNPTKLVFKSSLRKKLSNHRSALNHYIRFHESMSDAPAQEASDNNNDSDVNTDEGATFGLEKDLQKAIRDNIAQLEPHLKIIDGGNERTVDSGRIDILARDPDGCYVIIELKAGTAKGDVIAQILGYMGDIALETNEEVRGIIVAADFHKRVRSASRATPNLDLKSYSYRFEFN